MFNFIESLKIKVKEYNLSEEIVYLAYEILTWSSQSKNISAFNDKENKIFILLILSSIISVNQGNIRLPILDNQDNNKISNYLSSIIKNIYPDIIKELTINDILEMIIKANFCIGRLDNDFKPFIFINNYFYQQKTLYFENNFLDKLVRLIKIKNTFKQDESFFYNYFNNLSLSNLSIKQKEAIRLVCQNSFSIISGGAGTGKTFIITYLLGLFIKAGIQPQDIALAAPTGRAAHRMLESIQKNLNFIKDCDKIKILEILEISPPKTLHRLLGYSPKYDNFKYNENNKLSEGLIIIDEASMINIYLIDRLLSAIDINANNINKPVKLILIGDANQLPSVEVGNILKDLDYENNLLNQVNLNINSNKYFDYFIKLETNYRTNEPSIRHFGDFIKSGDISSFDNLDYISNINSLNKISFDKIQFISSEKIYDCLDFLYEKFFKYLIIEQQKTDLLDKLSKIKILCLTRLYKTGINEINNYFHNIFLKNNLDNSLKNLDFLPRELVLVNKNDYENNIYNGDLGIINQHNGINTVMFPNSLFLQEAQENKNQKNQDEVFVNIDLNLIKANIEHAFAMTVHKSQGSEFDHLVLVLPERDMPILTREIIYTAVTRSKKSLLIIGDKEIFLKGVKKQTERFSGVYEKLRFNLK